MDSTVQEVLEFIEEQDVRFVRLTFCDIFGHPKNVAIPAARLGHVFRHGLAFDASAVHGFLDVEKSDLFLHPDPTTLAVLPWRPHSGRVVRLFCDITYPDGTPFQDDGRYILKQAMKAAQDMGYGCRMGASCDFSLFLCDESGKPTTEPNDQAGCFDVSPLDKAENIRREIVLSLDEMGIPVTSSMHKYAPGQNMIRLASKDALISADNFFTFKWATQTVASQFGLFASFMPHPLEGESGNGMAVDMYLTKEGKSIFKSSMAQSKEAGSFIAGVLKYIPDITIFLNPIPNSYERFGTFEAPKYITWSPENRCQLIRIPASSDQDFRLELRSPDMICNPYLAVAYILYAGLEGIKQQLPLPEPANVTEKTGLDYKQLPANLGEAVEIAQKSDFLTKYVPQATVEKYLASKAQEWQEYNNNNLNQKQDLYLNRYFPTY